MNKTNIPMSPPQNITSERITELVSRLQLKINEYYTKYYSYSVPDKFIITEGKRYFKIIKTNLSNRSVYAFVDKTTGDILKPASWAAPTKHARGNVNENDYGMSGCGPYGINYLNYVNRGW